MFYKLLTLFLQLILGLTFLLVGSNLCRSNSETTPVTATQLEQITVKAQPINPTKQEGDLLYTGSEITPEGLKLAGIGGLTSVYQAFSILPGLNPELTDPTGIGGAEIRLRGIKSMFT
ncbi:MAG: hypothetical protein KAI69_07250, partial [Deltaproteobacteria bacterium]|nr:hypothetical protein [Deltaproteobacteria bacterium]